MSILQALYQELIVEHQKNPRNFGKPAAYTHEADGVNPSCGDRVTVYAQLEDATLQQMWFEGEGCAISQAAASILTQVASGKTTSELRELHEQFVTMLQGGEAPASLGDLAVFQGVAKVPARVKCAALAFSALRRAVLG